MRPIPLNIFLTISLSSFVTGALSFIIKLEPLIKERIEKLMEGIGMDGATGIPFLPKREIDKLLKFKYEKYLHWLGIFILVTFCFCIIYIISVNVPPLFNTNWYKIIVSLITWIGLLPALITVIISIRLYIYYIQLIKIRL